jgi:hypothetical protein
VTRCIDCGLDNVTGCIGVENDGGSYFRSGGRWSWRVFYGVSEVFQWEGCAEATLWRFK